jgi:glycerol-3-phosphate O-acyltransferase
MAKSVHHIFINLLKPNCFGFGPKEKRWTLRCKRLQEKFHIAGEIDIVRALAKKGTIVIVPTHTSHWDSVIIGLAMKRLGLSPLSWGAGLNLFNNRFFRYLFSQLGTYKIDRRKKNIPYLLTQKYYTCLTLEWGCHTLFYPSGTRSRSGAIESDLKLGLLGTPFEAQENNFQKQGAYARKLFIIPVVLNYHCVLEAQQLIRTLADKETAMDSESKPCCCVTKLLLGRNILCKGSEIFINIGTPLDVMGNRVDIEARSYDAQGKEVNLYEQFLKLNTTISKRPDSYIKPLSHKIVEIYYRINSVLSSHLVAFVAYELAKTIEGFSMQLEKITLKREDFMVALSKAYKAFYILYKEKKINFTAVLLNGQLSTIATDGLAKLGIYHAKPPLVSVKEGNLLIQDLWTLWYYHNRLIGYEVEKIFNIAFRD